jgi:hypothetical protein
VIFIIAILALYSDALSKARNGEKDQNAISNQSNMCSGILYAEISMDQLRSVRTIKSYYPWRASGKLPPRINTSGNRGS